MVIYHKAPPDSIAEGLRRAGYEVTGPNRDDRYATTTAICHGGDNPTALTFGPDGDGGTLAHCFTRDCTRGTGGQRKALESLRKAAGIRGGRATTPADAPEWRHIATYTHKARPPKKVFRQDWPGGGCDGWRGCTDTAPHKHIRQDKGAMDGYRLLAWGADAEGHVLVVVEGEKAAAALADGGVNHYGYTPVSWIGGTGGGAKADYEVVGGREVVLWPDNDNDGRKAMDTAARRCLEAGAVAVRIVSTEGMPSKGDAADVSPDVRLAMLTAATDYGPPPAPPAPERGADRGGLPGVSDAEAFEKVNFSPLSDAMRMLAFCPDRLLVAQDKASQTTELYLLNDVGVWEGDAEALGALMVRATTDWYTGNIDNRNNGLLTEGLRWVQRMRSDRGRHEAFLMVQQAYNMMLDDGVLPVGLRYCAMRDLDAELNFIGTKSGVLDLRTGEVLPPAEGAAKLVTRSIPDLFDIDADVDNPDVAQLLAHLPDVERAYLLEAVSFALRGSPARRWYLLHGPPASGKTTFLSAVGAALGSVKSGGYHAQLSLDALTQSRFATKNAHTEEIVDLPYARIASKSEMPRNGFLDIAMIKEVSGGGEKSIREIHKPARVVRRITATIIVAVNDADARRIDVTDDGFEDRTKILPYNPLDTVGGPRGVDYLNRMQDSERARMGVMAMLVKAGIGRDGPPADITSVKEAMERQKRESLDDMGIWLRDNLEYTGRKGDRILTQDLWIRAAAAFSTATDSREIAGYNKKSLTGLAKHVIAGFPSGTHARVEGRMQRVYAGVRWTEPEGEPPTSATTPRERCVRCGSERSALDAHGVCASVLCQSQKTVGR